MNSDSRTAAVNRRSDGDKAGVQPRPSSSPSSISVTIPKQDDCCQTRMLVENYSNFKRSGPPARVMFYEEGSWTDFAAGVVDSVRLGFEERKAVVEVGIDGAMQLLDLYRMLQIHPATGSQRSIAWIDVHGKCFFPKTFVDGGGAFSNLAGDLDNEVVIASRNPSVEADGREVGIEVRIAGDSTKRKNERVEDEKSEGSCSNNCQGKAKRPRRTDLEAESPAWPHVKLLKEGEKAFSIVKDLFLSGLAVVVPGATITSIRQWMRNGPLDRARYEVFQKQVAVTRAARGDAKMTFAWYGTSAEGVASILSHGFSMPSELPGPDAHGVGIYLSPIRSPQMSAMLSKVDDYGDKHVILCRVVLGKCEKVKAGSRQMCPSSVDYDTGVDDPVNPKWYVVWGANMNTHILPECVVSYRASDSVPGQLPGSSAFFANLLSKLRTSLPSSRVQEFRTLFAAYKDGKVAKDAFVRQLRSVVGDDVLASVIREFRG